MCFNEIISDVYQWNKLIPLLWKTYYFIFVTVVTTFFFISVIGSKIYNWQRLVRFFCHESFYLEDKKKVLVDRFPAIIYAFFDLQSPMQVKLFLSIRFNPLQSLKRHVLSRIRRHSIANRADGPLLRTAGNNWISNQRRNFFSFTFSKLYFFNETDDFLRHFFALISNYKKILVKNLYK